MTENKIEWRDFPCDTGTVKIAFTGGNAWFSVAEMAKLFGRAPNTIQEHVQNVFERLKKHPGAVMKQMPSRAPNGKIYQVRFYNLEAMVYIGMRANFRGTVAFKNYVLSCFGISKKYEPFTFIA